MSIAERKTSNAELALRELQAIAPEAPFLALGQTIFWDEPMKAGLALASKRLGHTRRLVAGVHDTDYFAKLPGANHPGGFKSFPHNDTTTKGLWSAAGEFSALFGSETVITKDMLLHAGLRLSRLQQARPNILDEATEAWRWRGIVSLDEVAPITAEVPLKQVFKELKATFNWAVNETLENLAGRNLEDARALADELNAAICDAQEEDQNQTLGDFYERLLTMFYRFCSNSNVDLEVSRTSTLLRFNTQTVHLPRFDLPRLYAAQATRAQACAAYDESIQGSGLYGLTRFGTGAIPFDLIIPGQGRGVIRLGTRGAVIGTPKPQFLSFKKPLQNLEELAEAVEKKFGPDCVLVGKAVTLIGMFAREFVFVFHEGASSYVKHSRKLHQLLNERLKAGLEVNPILRIRYDAWEAMQVCCSWLRLPAPLQKAFGTEELCAPSFAQRWREVSKEQEALLDEISKKKRPVDLIEYLDGTLGGSWNCLASEYRGLHDTIDTAKSRIDELKEQRKQLYGKIREAKQIRVDAEKASGDHFRAVIFEKEHTPKDLEERQRLQEAIKDAIHNVRQLEAQLRDFEHQQREVARNEDLLKIHERRRSIELEAELKRLRLIRHAVISSKGLQRANLRPSAWWFRMLCPDGLWFRETVNSAEYYLEPLL